MPAAPDTPPELVLASQSPRRRRLLEWLDLPFRCTAVDTPEDLDSPLASDPAALAVSLAVEKAEEARAQGLTRDAVTLCFDTVVVHEGAVLGKPLDEADAWRMLRSLSGRSHQVITGCALLLDGAEAPVTFSVATRVEMADLTDCRIAAWLAEGTYLGCAGAYNIEAQVASVTEDECFQNVAGLPLCHLYARLRALPRGVLPAPPACPIAACDAALARSCRLGPSASGIADAE